MPKPIPTAPCEWAESAAPGDAIDPDLGLRAAGYAFEDILPHEEFNGINKNIHRWVKNMSGAGLTFVGCGAAEDSGLLEVHDVFTVPAGSPTGTGLMFEEMLAANGTTDCSTVHGNGVYTLLTNGATTIVAKDGFDVSVSSAPMGNLIGCGPTHYATVLGSTVSLKNYPSSSAVWSYSHGATIQDVAVDSEYVYIVGASGTNGDGTATHRAISIATGLQVGSGAWGDSLYSVYATGSSVFIGGKPGGPGSAYAAAELGRGSFVNKRYITIPAAAIVSKNRSIYTDSVNTYIMSSAGLHVTPFSNNSLEPNVSGTSEGYLCADDTFVYVKETGTSAIKVFKKGNMAAPPFEIFVRGGTATVRAMYSDSRHLFVGYDVIGGKAWSIHRVAAQPKRYVYKNTLAGTFLPTGSLYCPETITY